MVGDGAEASGSEDPYTYTYALNKFFITTEGLDGLHSLINSSITLRVNDSSNGNVLGTVVVDMLPFALGEQRIELKDVELVPALVSEDQTQVGHRACPVA